MLVQKTSWSLVGCNVEGEESQNTRASFRWKEGCSIVGFTLIINVRDQGVEESNSLSRPIKIH